LRSGFAEEDFAGTWGGLPPNTGTIAPGAAGGAVAVDALAAALGAEAGLATGVDGAFTTPAGAADVTVEAGIDAVMAAG